MEASSRVFIGGVAEDISQEELTGHFDKFGPIAKVWIARNPPGFAFVDFEQIGDADEAIAQMNDVNGWRVEKARPRREGGGRFSRGDRGGRFGGGYDRDDRGGGGYGDRGGGGGYGDRGGYGGGGGYGDRGGGGGGYDDRRGGGGGYGDRGGRYEDRGRDRYDDRPRYDSRRSPVRGSPGYR